MNILKTFQQLKTDEQKKKDDKKRERKAFWLPLERYWVLYVFLLGTAILSSFAGLYIGLAPSANGDIVFDGSWDAARRIFFAVFFLVSFVTTAEGATLFWETKLVYHDVDEKGEKNDWQVRTARTALIVSIATVVSTGLAASHFIAAWTGSLNQFVEIPKAAQEYVVWSIPLLFVFHVTCAILYWYNSAESKLARYKNAIVLQTQAEMQQIEAEAFVEEYKKVAPQLARQRGVQRARELSKDDFYHREVQQGKDLDGDGHIGKPPQIDSQKPQDAPQERPATKFTTDEVLAKMGLTLAQAQTKYGGRRYGDFAGDCNHAFGDAHIDGPNMKKVFFGDINPTQAVPSNNHRR